MKKTVHQKQYQRMIDRLRQARIDAGIDQRDAAKKLKCAQSFISKIESYQIRLDILQAKELTKLYGVNIQDIVK